MKYWKLFLTLAVLSLSTNTIAEISLSGDYEFTESNLNIGYSEIGNLDITNGGTLESFNSYLGYLDGSSGTATISGPGSLWDAYTLTVGYGGVGDLNVQSGGNVTSFMGAVVNGSTTVDGSGSRWDISHTLSVNNSSMVNISNGGVISVQNGATVGSGTGVAKIIIDGADSQWISNGNLFIGRGGSGDVTIRNGGQLNGFDISLGNIVNDVGTVTVTGTGSTLNNSNKLVIGDSNSANVLNILNGGTVFSKFTTIGGGSSADGRGTMNVDGVNSRSDSSSYLFVGYRGNGFLNVTNGGTVTSQDGYIGRQGGSHGVAVVDGVGSSWINSGSIYVGYSGYPSTNTGVLTIQNEGTVTTNNMEVWSRSVLNLNDSNLNAQELSVQGSLISNGASNINGNVINTGSIVVDSGTVNFNNNMTHNGSEFRINAASQAVISGSVSGTGSYTGTGTLIFEGDVLSGIGTALINVEGDLLLTDTVSVFTELGGLLRGDEYDSFNIGGELQLDGRLDIALSRYGSPFNLSVGDTFDLFSAETITGEFDLLTSTVLDNSIRFQLDYLLDEAGTTDIVRLSVVSAVPVPAAIWLFGSGLVGLVGFASRKKA